MHTPCKCVCVCVCMFQVIEDNRLKTITKCLKVVPEAHDVMASNGGIAKLHPLLHSKSTAVRQHVHVCVPYLRSCCVCVLV